MSQEPLALESIDSAVERPSRATCFPQSSDRDQASDEEQCEADSHRVVEIRGDRKQNQADGDPDCKAPEPGPATDERQLLVSAVVLDRDQHTHGAEDTAANLE